MIPFLFNHQNRYKTLLILTVAYAIIMMLHWPVGFTFFTQLSNIFAAVTVALQLFIAKQTTKAARTLHLIKYMATLSIFITFIVYLTIIAPFDPSGFIGSYTQDHCASLCLHAIAPLLTLADFYLHDAKEPYQKSAILWGLLPLLAYLAFILILGQAGFRWWNMAAPYSFLNYLAPAGWFGFCPETMDSHTIGIGVFYVILFLFFVSLLISAIQYRLAALHSISSITQ